MTETRNVGTATVETLVAEVRTLMVGSRQVTLSVFNQLDRVDVDRVELFGRVSARGHDGLWVVGRDRLNGALVKSYVEHPWPYFEAGADSLPATVHWLKHQRREDRKTTRRGGNESIPVERHERVLVYASALRERWDRNTGRMVLEDPCLDFPPCDVEGLRRQAAEEVRLALDEIESWKAEYQAMKALPLIVLAGLR